jgi:hypothetical protein
MLLIVTLALHAQNDVTKILGIRVDGRKSEMIQKLKAKGYAISPNNKDVLVGEFNGTDVNIYIFRQTIIRYAELCLPMPIQWEKRILE